MATAHHLAVLRIVTSQSKGIRAQERTGVLGHRETDRQAPIGAKGPRARRRDAATPARVGRRFPSIRWVKLYGSRALGRQRPGSDIDLAFGSPDDCSAALAGAFKELPIPYTVDVTHGGSLEHEGLRRLCSVRRGGADPAAVSPVQENFAGVDHVIGCCMVNCSNTGFVLWER